jgi:hypothetical protein
MFIHDPQFSARRGDLLPKATAPPSAGHEHEDDTPKGQLSHGNPSLTAASAPDDLSPPDWWKDLKTLTSAFQGQRDAEPPSTAVQYTLLQTANLDEILTIL